MNFQSVVNKLNDNYFDLLIVKQQAVNFEKLRPTWVKLAQLRSKQYKVIKGQRKVGYSEIWMLKIFFELKFLNMLFWSNVQTEVSTSYLVS